MSACSRPALEDLTVAGRPVTHCVSCGSWSPPGTEAAATWAAAHRDAAAAANTEIERAPASP